MFCSQGVEESIEMTKQVGINPLLDIARKTYTESLGDMQNLVKQYQEEFNLPSLKTQFSAKKGHFLTIEGRFSDVLPDIFIKGIL